MKDTIQQHIFTFYLPMTAASLVTQLLIAGFIIGMNWEVIQFTVWSDEENRDFIDRQRNEEIEMGSVSGQEDQVENEVVGQ
jgi:hypothetical protein